MTNHFSVGMKKATELTKAGKLADATALIQLLLTNKAPDTANVPDAAIMPDAAIVPDGTAIEGAYTRLGEAEPVHAAPPKHNLHNAKAPRTSLREALRKIAAGGMPANLRAFKTDAPLATGAKFITLTHCNAQGQRDYKLYTPANQPLAAMPLIVMLHGCTQSPDDFAAGTGMNALAEKHGFLVAFPAQPSGANANKCWNWFRAEDQVRDRGEPALIAGLTRDILRDYPVDPARVYVAGLSAGGAAAAIMGAAYPDLFSAVGVHSGLAVGAATDIPQAFSAMRSGSSGTVLNKTVPTIVIHGMADTTVHPRNGDAIIAQSLRAFGGLKSAESKGTSNGGRSYRQKRYTDRNGRAMFEHWEIDGAGHAWAGGFAAGSFTDPRGPSASEEMVRFFLGHAKT